MQQSQSSSHSEPGVPQQTLAPSGSHAGSILSQISSSLQQSDVKRQASCVPLHV
jgi:hypothetical protein